MTDHLSAPEPKSGTNRLSNEVNDAVMPKMKRTLSSPVTNTRSMMIPGLNDKTQTTSTILQIREKSMLRKSRLQMEKANVMKTVEQKTDSDYTVDLDQLDPTNLAGREIVGTQFPIQTDKKANAFFTPLEYHVLKTVQGKIIYDYSMKSYETGHGVDTADLVRDILEGGVSVSISTKSKGMEEILEESQKQAIKHNVLDTASEDLKVAVNRLSVIDGGSDVSQAVQKISEEETRRVNERYEKAEAHLIGIEPSMRISDLADMAKELQFDQFENEMFQLQFAQSDKLKEMSAKVKNVKKLSEYSVKIVKGEILNNVNDFVPLLINQITEDDVNLVRTSPGSDNDVTLLDLHPSELAHQLSFYTQRLIWNITCEDVLKSLTTNERDNTDYSKIVPFMKHESMIADCLTWEILSTQDSGARSILVNRLIQSAERMKEINNYSGCFAVLLALTSPAVLRLRATWKSIPMKRREKFKELCKLCSISSDFAVLRMAINDLPTGTPRLLPSCLFYLHDISSVEMENRQAVMAHILIDFERCRQFNYENIVRPSNAIILLLETLFDRAKKSIDERCQELLCRTQNLFKEMSDLLHE